MSVRTYVRTYIRPFVHKKFLRFQWNWHIGRGRWVMHDPIPGQGEGHEPFKVRNPVVFFKTYLLRHLQMEVATDHRFLNYGTNCTISKFDQVGFLIFSLVFVSLDFEVGTNVICEESTVGPCTGLILLIIIIPLQCLWYCYHSRSRY